MKLRHLLVSCVLIVSAVSAVSGGPINCDPAAVRIDFSIRKDKFHPTRGTAKIVAVVKNVGTDVYNTRAGQQNVQIFEMPLGGVAGPAKKVCDFGTLYVGAEYRCEYDRPWDSSSPAEGEFPPNFKAMIVYDPDIRLDGNPKNDDINMKNNQVQAPGTRINDLFHRP